MNPENTIYPRPSPALISVIFLLGVHLSGVDVFLAHEPLFLSRAVRITQIRRSLCQGKALHSIQADILLAHYFLLHGRFLEAMHRINAALSLCIVFGLHKQHRVQIENQDSCPTLEFPLPPIRDSIEQGERIDAFWTVLGLLKYWGAALQWPPEFVHTLVEDVDIPWPFEAAAYEAVSLSHTVSV